ncbi:MAG: HDIG domain-containing protein [Candidatus Eisenbacteria bacterium]|nr:HDIG domain-containing protein [Candidatus Latescibacterota bacterium]MBD3301730.1 HDIG domain-containing protein [Candidatus Eisenbacteria bacterium]
MNLETRTRRRSTGPASRIGAFLTRNERLTRLLILVPVLAAGMSLFPPSFGEETLHLRVGDRAPRTVVAEFDFPVMKDPELLAEERILAASRSPVAFVRNDSVALEVFKRLGDFRTRMGNLRAGRPHRSPSPELEISQSLLVQLMLSEEQAPLLNQTEAVLQTALERGLVDREAEPLLRDTEAVQVQGPEEPREIPVEQIQTPSKLREAARHRAHARDLDPELLVELVTRFAVANLSFDEEATEELRRHRRGEVDPVAMQVQRGERIVAAREKVDEETLAKLESYREWRAERRTDSLARIGGWLGRVLLLLVGVAMFFAYLRLLRPDLHRNLEDLTLLALIASLVMGLTGLFLHALGLSPLMAPVAAAPILVGLLFDERLALVIGLGLTGLIALLTEAGAGTIAVLGVGAATAVFCVRELSQRRQFYRLVLLVPAAHVVTLLALALVHGQPMPELFRDALSAAINPMVAAGLAMFVMPLAEHGFRKCSDITLLEASDLNRPLLRRLMVEAPGTYHHCLMVGTLAEAGARVCGGNPLLARVIGYYHDIGKVTKPDYYIENIGMGRKNPHDRLSPSMSRLILESHVREGVGLARAERLPHVVVEGIRQHHGGSLMAFFWNKAKRIDPQAKEEDFRYPGPVPLFREAALVMLADQSDAASRALEEPTPSRIKGIVKQVIETRLSDGNLDESGLTLRDLSRVRDAFVPILAAYFHSRAAYVAPEGDGKRNAPVRDREPPTKSAAP